MNSEICAARCREPPSRSTLSSSRASPMGRLSATAITRQVKKLPIGCLSRRPTLSTRLARWLSSQAWNSVLKSARRHAAAPASSPNHRRARPCLDWFWRCVRCSSAGLSVTDQATTLQGQHAMAHSCDQRRSWLAISTVVPRRLMSSNTPMISAARRGSRLPVGSSASSKAGRCTTARAMPTRCC